MLHTTIFELGLIHEAANINLISARFLKIHDNIFASRRLSQDQCLLLSLYQRLKYSGSINILGTILTTRKDIWQDARINYRPSLTKENLVVNGLFCIPIARDLNTIKISCFDLVGPVIIQGEKYRRVFPQNKKQYKETDGWDHTGMTQAINSALDRPIQHLLKSDE